MNPERKPIGETMPNPVEPTETPPTEQENAGEAREISGEELTNVMVKCVRFNEYAEVADSLNLSEEEAKKGIVHANEWSLESKARLVEAMAKTEHAEDYEKRFNQYLSDHNLVAKLSSEAENNSTEDGAEEENNDAENKESERKLSLFRRLGHTALATIEKVKGYVKEHKKEALAMAASAVMLVGSLFGAAKLAERSHYEPENTSITMGDVDEDIVDSLAGSIPIYNPEGDSSSAETTSEAGENNESFNVKGDMRAIGYEAYDKETGTWRWDLTSTDYHIAKAGKYNFSNFRKFKEDYAKEHNLDPDDLGTAKEAILDVYEKSGSAGLSPLIFNLVDEGIGNLDKDFKDLNTAEIKALLEKRPDLAEKSMDEIKDVFSKMDISEDHLDPNTKYYNFYLSPSADGVDVVEYGARGDKGDYYSVSSEKSAEGEVYKLSYKGDDGEVKVLYVKKICGQLVNEKGFYAKKTPPEIVTTKTTETSTDTATTTTSTSTETTTTSTDTTETTTTTTDTGTGTGTGTSTSTSKIETTTTSTYTTPIDTTTTSTYITTMPVTTPKVEVSSGPATGTSIVVTNEAKNSDKPVFNWNVNPGDTETAAVPTEFSGTTTTTTAVGAEDISKYANTDANGNRTDTDYSGGVGKIDDSEGKKREDDAANSPTNTGNSYIPDTDMPPVFGPEDQGNDLTGSIFGN